MYMYKRPTFGDTNKQLGSFHLPGISDFFSINGNAWNRTSKHLILSDVSIEHKEIFRLC